MSEAGFVGSTSPALDIVLARSLLGVELGPSVLKVAFAGSKASVSESVAVALLVVPDFLP